MEVQIEIGVALAWVLPFVLSVVLFFFSMNYKAKILRSEQEKQAVAFKAAIEAEEMLKSRIAHDIHDEVSGKLAVLSQNAERHKMGLQNQTLDPWEFDHDVQLIAQVSSSLQSIAMDLAPPMLTNFGLVKSLSKMVENLSTKSNAIEFQAEEIQEDQLGFSEPERVNIYRVCSEILNNLAKHANFGYLRVSLERKNSLLIVSFIHDGAGISEQEVGIYLQSSSGLGLKSIKSRSLALNATINYLKEKFFNKVILSIPLKP